MEYCTNNHVIDLILDTYKDSLGKHFELYHNHVYRVYNFAVPYININEDENTLSIASAFHDLGIWTNNTFNYLQPSMDLAKKYCLAYNTAPDKTAEIITIIEQHHKLTRVKTSLPAEIFRQADLIDLTLGLIRKGRTVTYIRTVKKAFPNKGFHLYLLKIFLKNLFQHPLKPLPMYKL
jgi:predicted hydrolase (HD superfamily)